MRWQSPRSCRPGLRTEGIDNRPHRQVAASLLGHQTDDYGPSRQTPLQGRLRLRDLIERNPGTIRDRVIETASASPCAAAASLAAVPGNTLLSDFSKKSEC